MGAKVLSCVFHDLEPVMGPVFAHTLELRARKPDRAVVKATGHRLYFAPSGGLLIRSGPEKVVARVKGGRAPPSRFAGENKIDGSRL